MQDRTQVLVIGGGPAGSSAATLLAREGFDVTLLERDVFPREHIGESLLPSSLQVLELTGVREKLEASGFVRKHGVFFSWGEDAWDVDWGKPGDPDSVYSFQVVRAEFDDLLLKHAAAQGVKVHEGISVESLAFREERPVSARWVERGGEGRSGEIAFDYLVDASGRAGIMSSRYLQNRRFNKAFQNVALWGYWKGARIAPQTPPGGITIGSVPNGWLWAIPLHNGTYSVGLVVHKTTFKDRREESGSLRQLYLDAIADAPVIAGMLESAELVTPLQTEQDFSYIAEEFSGPGYFIVGDAACFLDPLLSSGVHLATYSALLAAAGIASIHRGEVDEEEAREYFDHTYRQAYLRFMVVVSAMYQHYRGKDDLFWKAQKLTRHDVSADDVKRAFSHVITGLEDVENAEVGGGVEVVEEVQRFINEAYHRSRRKDRKVLKSVIHEDLYGSASGEELPAEVREERKQALADVKLVMTPTRIATSEDTAVNGMYVRTRPTLGFARVEEAAVVG